MINFSFFFLFFFCYFIQRKSIFNNCRLLIFFLRTFYESNLMTLSTANRWCLWFFDYRASQFIIRIINSSLFPYRCKKKKKKRSLRLQARRAFSSVVFLFHFKFEFSINLRVLLPNELRYKCWQNICSCRWTHGGTTSAMQLRRKTYFQFK